MGWKTDYRSIYYDGAPEPEEPDLAKGSTALLLIDLQNTYLARPNRASLSAAVIWARRWAISSCSNAWETCWAR